MEDVERHRRLKCWKDGNTGYPLIDAGMRQLVMEGWMPQKVRLACSTFLVEGLGISWKDGMHHFSEFLVDFDEAINSNMWQNAGCVGLDPYYVGMNYKRRMYWDSSGDYVRQWCPELRFLPDMLEDEMGKTVDCLYEPWMSPVNILEKAGVSLGETYPHRVCNDRETRSSYFAKIRDLRLKWPTNKIDSQKRDFVQLGSAGYVGLFTPRAAQTRQKAFISN
jgi:deoxyribodipyrimidine photo-lyase